MSISAVSSNSDFAQPNDQSSVAQAQQYFRQLAMTLQSGNLSGAQKAYTGLQNLLQAEDSTSQDPAANQANTRVKDDFAALGKALSSGDLSQAQSKFSKFRTDLQSLSSTAAPSQGIAAAHPAHHHHKPESGSSSTTDADAQSPSRGSTLDLYA